MMFVLNKRVYQQFDPVVLGNNIQRKHKCNPLATIVDSTGYSYQDTNHHHYEYEVLLSNGKTIRVFDLEFAVS